MIAGVPARLITTFDIHLGVWKADDVADVQGVQS